jgi:FixJ family two-component response regulator
MMEGVAGGPYLGGMKSTIATIRKPALISVVDDQACVRESLCSLLRSAGYTVERFDSAESFLTGGNWDQTACLILDVRLPGMGGLELQRRLAEAGHPPIVFISGHATEKEEKFAMQSGAIAFLRKPFGDELLLKAVHDSIDPEEGEAGALPIANKEAVQEFYFMGMPAVSAPAAHWED